MKVAWIGLGAMGRPMALAALRAGHALSGYARRPAEQDAVRAAGGVVTDRLVDVVSDAEIVCVTLFSEAQVRDVLIGGGAIAAMAPGAILAIHSTVGAPFVRELAGSRDDVDILDAGFSGGPDEAWAGALTMMVGGSPDALDRARPVFSAYAGHIAHLGPVGSGMTLKLVNNLMFAAHVAIARDALRLVAEAGIARDAAVATMMRGSGGSNALALVGAAGERIAAMRPYLEKDVAIARQGTGGADLGALDVVTREYLVRDGA